MDWVNEDTAVVTYQASRGSSLQECIKQRSRSFSKCSHQLDGKWLEKDNPKNPLLYNKDKIVYARDGQIYNEIEDNIMNLKVKVNVLAEYNPQFNIYYIFFNTIIYDQSNQKRFKNP
ncbi:hypothetical protein [Neobacillus sp.]|uniref:hypothetical protein n=1 Tax=Neobacillus sp. TaxID=2675273 RepID=UPI002898D117|nr:hypothetical protein [Neobacillus sp.]